MSNQVETTKTEIAKKNESKNLIQEIHSRALRAAQSFKKAEGDLLDVLQEADRHKVYYHYNCKSLFEYSVQVLELSESTSYNFITVARKAIEVPALKTAIQSGELNLTNARKITPVLNSQNQGLWLEKAILLSSRKLEEEVTRVMPKPATPEKIKFVTDDRVNINFELSKDMNEKLKRVQDLESQKSKKPATLEETMGAALEAYLEKNDPIQKAQRAIERQIAKPIHVNLTPDNSKAARALNPAALSPTKSIDDNKIVQCDAKPVALQAGRLNAATRHEIFLRDNSQCTFINFQNQRCLEKRWIDIHHVIPRHADGNNSPENLKILCSSHHRMLHFKELDF